MNDPQEAPFKSNFTKLQEARDQLVNERNRLQVRLDFIRNHLSDPLSVDFALNASDEEIDELEEDC